MTSQIATIFATVAAQPIALNGSTMATYDLAALPSSADRMILPARLLTPLPARAGAASRLFGTFAGNRWIDWTIYDLMLFRGVAAGIGLEDVAPYLIAYSGAYLDILPALRTPQWSTTSVVVQPDVINWPDGSDQFYDGVRVTLVIRELL